MTDDVAGKAYVEQFGLETFTRADNAVRANKASKQTAETFQASATFLELLQIWGPLEPDIQQKIKFAKFHALRIAKALKAGEDPNLSNPNQEEESEEAAPALDPSDAEVQALSGQSRKDRQPSVVDAPDETDRLQARLAPQSSINESIHPSRAPSAPPPNDRNSQAASAGVSPLPKDAASFYATNQNEVSPVSPDRKSSIGGNYFPRIPSPTSAQAEPNLPPAPSSAPDDQVETGQALDLPSAPTAFGQAQPMAPRTPLDSFQAPPTLGQPPIASVPPNLPQAPPQSRNITQQPATSQPPMSPYPPSVPAPSNVTQQPSSAPALAAPAYTSVSQAAVNTKTEPDEESMMKAQKHARWAISALNFEDVPTAIKEFQLALQTLGAR